MALLATVLIIVLMVALLGTLPMWGYSRGWSYWPGGMLGLMLLVVIVLAVAGVV